MAVHRDDDERKARLEALLEDARRVRDRASSARERAHDLIRRSAELLRHEQQRVRRDLLVKRTRDALEVAKAGELVPFRRGRRKKSA
jgi:hypothetical protein